jgi:uroporphyrinogen decarboxylase
MNHRERILAAIRHEVPDRIPVDAIHIENTDTIGHLLEIPVESVYDRLGIDGQGIAADQYTGELPVRDGKTLSPWGTENGNDYGTTHFYPLAVASSAAEVDRYPWPEGCQFNFDDLAAALKDWTGEYALRGPYWISGPLFCTTASLMGMEEALCKMLVEPAVFEACVEQVFRFSASYVERFIAAAGPRLDILYLADDFASQRGLIMKPALWRKFLKPRYEKLFAIGKRLGLPIWFHSCGDITAVLPDLIEIGMDVWETVQLHTLPISAEELKRLYGQHITFFGGVNTQRLPFQTPDEVADEVRHCMDMLGKGGGYICGPDHHIKPDVPAANVVALFDTARTYAKSEYTLFGESAPDF